MIEEGRIGASGRGDRAGGWMLLHAPTASAKALPPIIDWLDKLGLADDGSGRLRFGSHMVEWVEGGAARSLFGGMAIVPARLVGLVSPPDTDRGLRLGFRSAESDSSDVACVQRLSALVGMIASTLPDAMIGWLPGRIWSSAALFADAVIASERQGLPPVMHLVWFASAESPEETSVASDGLAWFCGHELKLTAPSPVSARQAIRRAARLAVDALVHRGLAGPMVVDGMDTGEKLIIGAAADGIVPIALRPPPG